VKEWSYEPATLNGAPVASSHAGTVSFEIPQPFTGTMTFKTDLDDTR
jgi:hypothetical protein